jgi:hypothetical protein
MLIFLSLIEAHKWAQLGNLKNIRDSLGHTAKEGGGCGGGRLLENKILSKMFLHNLCCTCLNGFNLTFASYFVRQTSHSVLWETRIQVFKHS